MPYAVEPLQLRPVFGKRQGPATVLSPDSEPVRVGGEPRHRPQSLPRLARLSRESAAPWRRVDPEGHQTATRWLVPADR